MSIPKFFVSRKSHANLLMSALSLFLLLLSLSGGSSAYAAPVTGLAQPSVTPERIVVIVLENESASKAINEPFLNSLAKQGTYFQNSFGVTRPSQPNYFALVSGSTWGVSSNKSFDIDGTSIVDLLEAKNLTWRSYSENFPGNCFTGASSNGYTRKHSPFISFKNIQSNPKRCVNLSNGDQFFIDLQAHNMPHFSFYSPTLDDSGHDTGVGFAANWLSGWFKKFVTYPESQRTLVIVTFDEGGPFNQNVYTVFWGASVQPGLVNTQKIDHYGILRTIENVWNLGTLGREDAKATPAQSIWR